MTFPSRDVSVIRTGLLAYGTSGSTFHAPFLHTHDGFELRAVTERSVKSARNRYPNLISYDTVEALLADPEIDLVVINTPNFTHFEYARMALQAGKHVLIEKPVAVTTREVNELYDLAASARRHLLPYQNRRYDSDLALVHKAVSAGLLGDLVEAHIRFDRYRLAIGPKIAKETPVPGSGILWDLGPHLLDAALMLFGHPTAWTRTTGNFRPNTQVPDYAHIRLAYPSGLQVHLTASMLVADVQPGFVLHGTRGSLLKHRADVQEKQLQEGMLPDATGFAREPESMKGRLTLISAEGATTTDLAQDHDFGAGPPLAGYRHLFDAVHQTLTSGAPFPVTEDDIKLQIRILESADGPHII
jgi:scyllo-inositol 2-dehydrogenase (NADP+)